MCDLGPWDCPDMFRQGERSPRETSQFCRIFGIYNRIETPLAEAATDPYWGFNEN